MYFVGNLTYQKLNWATPIVSKKTKDIVTYYLLVWAGVMFDYLFGIFKMGWQFEPSVTQNLPSSPLLPTPNSSQVFKYLILKMETNCREKVYSLITSESAVFFSKLAVLIRFPPPGLFSPSTLQMKLFGRLNDKIVCPVHIGLGEHTEYFVPSYK